MDERLEAWVREGRALGFEPELPGKPVIPASAEVAAEHLGKRLRWRRLPRSLPLAVVAGLVAERYLHVSAVWEWLLGI